MGSGFFGWFPDPTTLLTARGVRMSYKERLRSPRGRVVVSSSPTETNDLLGRGYEVVAEGGPVESSAVHRPAEFVVPDPVEQPLPPVARPKPRPPKTKADDES